MEDICTQQESAFLEDQMLIIFMLVGGGHPGFRASCVQVVDRFTLTSHLRACLLQFIG